MTTQIHTLVLLITQFILDPGDYRAHPDTYSNWITNWLDGDEEIDSAELEDAVRMKMGVRP